MYKCMRKNKAGGKERIYDNEVKCTMCLRCTGPRLQKP